jgi:hypothetical protein
MEVLGKNMARIMKVAGYAKAEFYPPETVAKTMRNFLGDS